MKKKPKRDWEDPYYTYMDGKKQMKIDVTSSSRYFPNAVDGLGDVAAEFFRPRRATVVLDFGAGKLRNAIYLLRLNYEVTAVEYAKAYETEAGAKRLAQARRFKRFSLVLPKDFLASSGTYDAAILVNAANVVPDEHDRKKIIRECAKRLRAGGFLLLMSEYGEPHQEPGATKRRALNGGWCYGLHKRFKSYNIEFNLPGLRALAPKDLLREIKPISSNHHRALLYERI